MGKKDDKKKADKKKDAKKDTKKKRALQASSLWSDSLLGYRNRRLQSADKKKSDDDKKSEKKDEKKPGLTSSKNGIDIEDKQYKNQELDQPSELTHEGMDAAASA